MTKLTSDYSENDFNNVKTLYFEMKGVIHMKTQKHVENASGVRSAVEKGMVLQIELI